MTTRNHNTVGLFHVGPPKSGTTWIYRCLTEHPAIAVPPKDSIHFFDMHFDRGTEWYGSHFAAARPGQLLFDPTPSYLRSPWVPVRLAAHNPDARIAVCLRDPIERAFSHYWHEKKKGRVRHDFGEVLVNYDLYSSWLEPGFYAEHLERYLAVFPRQQILVQRFEVLQADPAGFLGELLAFFGVDPKFVPSVLADKINAAGPRHNAVGMGLHSIQKAMSVMGLSRAAGCFQRSALLSGQAEYVRGIPKELADRLGEICEPEIVRLERLLGIDLGTWRQRAAPTCSVTSTHRHGEAA